MKTGLKTVREKENILIGVTAQVWSPVQRVKLEIKNVTANCKQHVRYKYSYKITQQKLIHTYSLLPTFQYLRMRYLKQHDIY